MKNFLFIRTVLIFFLLFGVSLWHGFAHAYNWHTHKAMVEVAVNVMQSTETYFSNLDPGFILPPPGVDPTRWSLYISAVRAAPDKLSKLRIGAINRIPEWTYTVADDDPCACNYFKDDNMTRVEENRIEDFRYVLRRPADPCLLQPADKTRVLGGVLGWHAAMVDDQLYD